MMTATEKEHYLNMGFNNEQIEEISLGQKEGLNISIYANKDYLAMQMRQIRLGLKEHLPVKVYAKTEFDWLQMEEIREGLKAGVDVISYALPEISHEKMQQLRKGLQEGINMYSYINLDAGIIREIRKAKDEGVDIFKYIDEGYDAEQLREIRHALMKRINLDGYISAVYRAASIVEICNGLESGIDVSAYAKPYYSWRQMRELRLGLENRVEISKYNSKLHSWEQMREISLGMEQGIDVEGSRLLRYTASEMRKKRLAILEGNSFDVDKDIDDILENLVHTKDFRFEFSPDNMEAYITVLLGGEPISRGTLMTILEENGITKGIDNNVVERIVNGKYGRESMLIAKGRLPVRGEDGRYEFFFRTNLEKKPKVLEDGSVDYQNMDWFEMVHEGQKLAFYYPAKEGVDGYTVKGDILQARKGAEQRILVGKGFRLEDDKRTYVATLEGIIRLDGNEMHISNHMVLDEITMATGNITFNGSIHILGDVGNGTVVKAEGDVVIDGNIEGATIESGGSVILKKGMNSGGHGMITAEKDVISKFFESVKVVAKGNIDVNKCLNSQLYAEGKISSTKVIAGGVAQAESGFDIRNVGNHAGLRTVLKLKVNDKLWEEYSKTKAAISDAQHELKTLNSYYEEFKEKFPPEARKNMEVFKKVEKAVYTKTKLLQQLKNLYEDMEQRVKKSKDAKIVISGQAHEGAVLEINGSRWEADNRRNITVKKHNNEVVVLNS